MHSEVQGCISPDHPALAGHFPGNPVVPGVVLLTELLELIERQVGWTADAIRLTSVKFTAILRPDEAFLLVLDQLSEQQLSFAFTKGDTRIASGVLSHTGHMAEQHIP